MALQFVTKNSLARIDESISGEPTSVDGTKTADLDLPYDIGFMGGYDENFTAEKVSVRTYGQMCMGRSGIFIGTVGWLHTPPNGYTVIDIEKNGTSIFSTKPMFAQTNYLSLNIGSGVNEYAFATTAFVPGNRITFKVTAVGSVNMPGSGMRVILKCKV